MLNCINDSIMRHAAAANGGFPVSLTRRRISLSCPHLVARQAYNHQIVHTDALRGNSQSCSLSSIVASPSCHSASCS